MKNKKLFATVLIALVVLLASVGLLLYSLRGQDQIVGYKVQNWPDQPITYEPVQNNNTGEPGDQVGGTSLDLGNRVGEVHGRVRDENLVSVAKLVVATVILAEATLVLLYCLRRKPPTRTVSGSNKKR
jgi:hypothetical protein